MNRRAALFLFALIALCLPSCVGTGGTTQVIGFATVRGNGDARVDATGYGIAIGEMHGSTGLFVAGSGFPLTIPIESVEGGWIEFVKAKPARRGMIGRDPIPWKASLMYRPAYGGEPGELQKLAILFGYPSIPAEPSPFDEPPPVEPAPPVPQP